MAKRQNADTTGILVNDIPVSRETSVNWDMDYDGTYSNFGTVPEDSTFSKFNKKGPVDVTGTHLRDESDFQALSEEAVAKLLEGDANSLRFNNSDMSSFSKDTTSHPCINETYGTYFMQRSEYPNREFPTVITKPQKDRACIQQRRVLPPVNENAEPRCGEKRDTLTGFFKSSQSNGMGSEAIIDKVMKFCKEQAVLNTVENHTQQTAKRDYVEEARLSRGIMEISNISSIASSGCGTHTSTPKRLLSLGSGRISGVETNHTHLGSHGDVSAFGSVGRFSEILAGHNLSNLTEKRKGSIASSLSSASSGSERDNFKHPSLREVGHPSVAHRPPRKAVSPNEKVKEYLSAGTEMSYRRENSRSGLHSESKNSTSSSGRSGDNTRKFSPGSQSRGGNISPVSSVSSSATTSTVGTQYEIIQASTRKSPTPNHNMPYGIPIIVQVQCPCERPKEQIRPPTNHQQIPCKYYTPTTSTPATVEVQCPCERPKEQIRPTNHQQIPCKYYTPITSIPTTVAVQVSVPVVVPVPVMCPTFPQMHPTTYSCGNGNCNNHRNNVN